MRCIWASFSAPVNLRELLFPPPVERYGRNTLFNGRHGSWKVSQSFTETGYADKKGAGPQIYGTPLQPLKTSLSAKKRFTSASCKSANVQREFTALPNHASARAPDSYVKTQSSRHSKSPKNRAACKVSFINKARAREVRNLQWLFPK